MSLPCRRHLSKARSGTNACHGESILVRITSGQASLFESNLIQSDYSATVSRLEHTPLQLPFLTKCRVYPSSMQYMWQCTRLHNNVFRTRKSSNTAKVAFHCTLLFSLPKFEFSSARIPEGSAHMEVEGRRMTTEPRARRLFNPFICLPD